MADFAPQQERSPAKPALQNVSGAALDSTTAASEGGQGLQAHIQRKQDAALARFFPVGFSQSAPARGDNFNGKTASLKPQVQAKLAVNTPGDAWEQEADQVAERVLQPDLVSTNGDDDPTGNVSQSDNQAQRQPILHREPASDTAGSGLETPQGFDLQLKATAGRGSPLPPEAKLEMEGKIGADFSKVRIHQDAEAASMSESIQAKAFTSGNDIYFGEGQLDTQGRDGKRLLAHELTHVVQQGGKANDTIRRQEDPKIAAAVAKQLLANYPSFKGAVMKEDYAAGKTVIAYAALLQKASASSSAAYLKQIAMMQADGLAPHLLRMSAKVQHASMVFVLGAMKAAQERATKKAVTTKAATAKSTKKPAEVIDPNKIAKDARTIYDVCVGYFTDGADAVAVLRGKSVLYLKTLKTYYLARFGMTLAQHLEDELSATNYRAAMTYLSPALPLLEQLRLQKGWDDNEEGMIHLIKTSTPANRKEASLDGKVGRFILDEIDFPDAYDMYKLIYPPAKFPNEVYQVALKMIDAGNGWTWDDDDFVYLVILDLTPAQRKDLWYKHKEKIAYVSASANQIKTLCFGKEVDVVKTTMNLATDGAGTYDNLAKKTVEHAGEKIKRQAELQKIPPKPGTKAAAELEQLGNVQDLAKPSIVQGGVSEWSFLGDLKGDLSEAEFKQYAAVLGVSQFDQAKLMILNAVGTFDDNEKAMKDAFEMIKDEQLRRKLWVDKDVQAAFKAALNDTEKVTLAAYREADSFKVAEDKFLVITTRWVFSDPSFVELIQLLTTISEVDRKKLVLLYPDNLKKFTSPAGGYGDLAKAVKEAAETGKVHLELAITAASKGAGTSEELINSTLDQLNDLEYFQLRLGYALAHGFKVPETAIPGHMQQAARDRYAWLLEQLGEEMGFDQKESTQDLFLKAPSLMEMRHAGGMEMSMYILQQRVRDKITTRNGSPADYFIDLFSNTGGVADLAAIQALGAYNKALEDGTASQLDLAGMAAHYDQFNEAYDAHVAAIDSVADVASTVAAIAVAIVITVATAGTAGPGAVAGLSAYIGGASASTIVGAAVAAGTYKVAVSKIIGGEHFDLSDEGGKAFALGGVDGVLVAVTGGLAKGLQTAFFKTINVEARLASEMLVGEVLEASQNSLRFFSHQASVGLTRGGIDGAISGALGNLVLTAADESTWRKGIWDTLTTFGAALLQGAFIGGATGSLVSGTMSAGGAKLAKTSVGKLEEFARKAKIDPLDFNNFEVRELKGLNRVLSQFTPDETVQLWGTLKAHGLQVNIGTIVDDFFGKGKWKIDPNAEVLGIWQTFRYTNAEGKELLGTLELVREGDQVGLRAVIPYDGYGNKLILDPNRTTTAVGRSVEAALHPDGFPGAMNLPIGTNYFRFQANFFVGKMKGGGNVLDIAEWTWAKNNAWLQAAIDRGDIIRFVSDPRELRNLYYNAIDETGGLTVTGEELGVLMNRGYAPDLKTGIVKKIEEIGMENIPRDWKKVQMEVKRTNKLDDIDKEAYDRFLHESQETDRTLKLVKDKGTERIEKIQTNTFGGNTNVIKNSKLQ